MPAAKSGVVGPNPSSTERAATWATADNCTWAWRQAAQRTCCPCAPTPAPTANGTRRKTTLKEEGGEARLSQGAKDAKSCPQNTKIETSATCVSPLDFSKRSQHAALCEQICF
mmetsp:Transcript_33930/g.77531  ORF Transcript_33930/g.77531 Transcript_33930/m.77531 type:complete len:113 (+) Transcript_33930:151-489(+)